MSRDAISASGHAVRAWFATDPTHPAHQDQTVDIAGWTLEAPALADGNLALYAEANGMRRQYRLGSEEHTEFGRAARVIDVAETSSSSGCGNTM